MVFSDFGFSILDFGLKKMIGDRYWYGSFSSIQNPKSKIQNLFFYYPQQMRDLCDHSTHCRVVRALNYLVELCQSKAAYDPLVL
jgi:hypothetical protein